MFEPLDLETVTHAYKNPRSSTKKKKKKLLLLFSQGSFICSLVKYQPLTFNRWYVYPDWAYMLGWVLALSSILLVPGWALYKLSTGTGTLTQVGQLCNCANELKKWLSIFVIK